MSDSKLRRLEFLHKAGTFQQFLDALEDPNDVVNLLDFPVEDGYAPDIIK